jgi:membrane-bound inhibitor of C-type lysozyme
MLISADMTGCRTRIMARFAYLVAPATALAMVAVVGPARATEARYTCSGGDMLTADFTPPGAVKGSVNLSFGMGRDFSLPQVMSADGGRYANADMEFRIKGRSATLTMMGVKETCAAQ